MTRASTEATNGGHGVPTLHLSVQYAVEAAGVPTRAKIRRWVQAVVTQEAEITLRLVGAEEGQSLNRDYRGKDYATNVLTFVYDDLPHLAGDIVICPPVVEREARQQDKSLEAHYAHLVVHGVLHLHGYDHEDEAEAREMEALESQIVTKLGYPDPYRETGDQ